MQVQVLNACKCMILAFPCKSEICLLLNISREKEGRQIFYFLREIKHVFSISMKCNNLLKKIS